MSEGVQTLFTKALGLVAPWEVEKVDLDTARRRIDFEVRCNAKTLACPQCRAPDQRIHQCVAPSGIVSSVLAMTASTCVSLIVRGAPGRGASSSPSSRCSTNRARHFDTVC